MNTKILVVAVCSALALGTIGCEKESPKTTPDKNKAGTTDALKDMKDKAAGVVDQAKEKAVAAAQTAYDSAKAELDALKTKLSASTGAEKPAWQTAWDGLKTGLDDAGKKLTDLKSNSSTWQTASSELTSALNKLGEDIKVLAAKVK